jgi:hypothetical protein
MCLAQIATSRGDKAAAGVEIARSMNREDVCYYTIAIAAMMSRCRDGVQAPSFSWRKLPTG